jgi:uncharacterized protein (DUF697 family)
MGLRNTAATWAGNAAARRAAPVAAARGANQFLSKAIDGFRGFSSARDVARKHLERRRDVDLAVRDVIDSHLRMAGAQGFVTNLGGFVVMPVAIPANMAGIAVLQLRMVAAVAHLRGYDIGDPKVRTAALLTLLGRDGVASARKDGHTPAGPHEMAMGPDDIDPAVTEQITARVTQELVTRIGGKHATLALAKRVPVLGGAVSAGVDAISTHSIGRYADQQFSPHVMIEPA